MNWARLGEEFNISCVTDVLLVELRANTLDTKDADLHGSSVLK